MNIHDHPEYDQYHIDAELVATCRRAIDNWIDSGEAIVAPDGVAWTPQRAHNFVLEMGDLFQRYNFVLWQTFSYCRRCQGGCCVAGASQVTQFDALALALLEQPFPALAPRAAVGDCIYLGEKGCRWPARWRPVKCASFYCLGSGDWELDATDARYERITRALQAVVREHLPDYLKRYERNATEPLHAFLADPIGFAETLGAALIEIFVAPFAVSYDVGVALPGSRGGNGIDAPSPMDETLSFVANAVEIVWQTSSHETAGDDEQFLADLEQLEWIAVERPPEAAEALEAMLGRYTADNELPSPDAGSPESLRREMRVILRRLLDE